MTAPVGVSTFPPRLLQVHLDGEARAKYERWQAAGGWAGVLFGPRIIRCRAAGSKPGRRSHAAPARPPASGTYSPSTCFVAGRAVIEQHLRDGTLLQQYTAVLEILLRLRQVGGTCCARHARCVGGGHSAGAMVLQHHLARLASSSRLAALGAAVSSTASVSCPPHTCSIT